MSNISLNEKSKCHHQQNILDHPQNNDERDILNWLKKGVSVILGQETFLQTCYKSGV